MVDQKINNTLIFVPFRSVYNWSVQYLQGTSFSYNPKFTLVKIGSFLTRNKDSVEVQDDLKYQRVTIKLNNKGVTKRNQERGKNIGTKKQYIASAGQFIMSKIDARNGAFGIVPMELDGALITNDFPSFDVDQSIILPSFFVLLTTTKEFLSYAQASSSGTTGRQRINMDLFLNVKIPLPPLTEQKVIVDTYQDKIKKAKEAKQQAKDLEQEIEDYLTSELGIEIQEEKKKNGLQFIKYRNLNRRDDTSSTFFKKQGKFDLVNLGNKFQYIKRKWSKTGHNQKHFDYIELGGVHPLLGITSYTTLETRKAPSRANQTVKSGDLIIGTTRPYLKRFSIVSNSHDGFVCSSGFTVFKRSSNYHLEFLLEFLKSKLGEKQLEKNMTGALYPAITKEALLNNIKVPFPPINVQKQIINHIGGLKDQIRKLIQKAVDLEKSAKDQFEAIIFSSDT